MYGRLEVPRAGHSSARLVLLMRYTKYPYSPSVLPLQMEKGRGYRVGF